MSKSLKITLLYGAVLFIDILETTLLNVGIPSIANGLRVSPLDLNIAVTSFIWGLTLLIPLAGWLGTRFGNKRVFVTGQALFLLFSITCSIVQSPMQLAFLRTLQGASAGLVIPLGLALLMSALTPEERTTTMAKISIVPRLAPLLGPITGGYTIVYFGWRALFLLKVPMAIACLFLSHRWLQEDAPVRSKESFDWKGLALCSICLACLLATFAFLGRPNGIYAAIFSGTIAFTSLIAFVRHEGCVSNPIIPMHLFSYKTFAEGNIVQMLGLTVLFGLTMISSIYLQKALDFPIVTTGWVLSVSTIGMMLAIPIVTTLHIRVGPRPLILAGFLLLMLALFSLSTLVPGDSPYLASLIMAIAGMGSALIMGTNAAVIFTEIPANLVGAASSVFSLVRQVGSCLGIAMTGAILMACADYGITSFHIAMYTLIAIATVGAALSSLSSEMFVRALDVK